MVFLCCPPGAVAVLDVADVFVFDYIWCLRYLVIAARWRVQASLVYFGFEDVPGDNLEI